MINTQVITPFGITNISDYPYLPLLETFDGNNMESVRIGVDVSRYTGDGVKINVMGDEFGSIKVKEDDNVLVVKGRVVENEMSALFYTFSKWIPAKDIQKGDCIAIPRLQYMSDLKLTDKIKQWFYRMDHQRTFALNMYNADFYRLVGYYLASGDVVPVRREIIFRVMANHGYCTKDLTYLLGKYMRTKDVSVDKHNGVWIISVPNNNDFTRLFTSTFATNHHKRLFSKMLTLPNQGIIELLEGITWITSQGLTGKMVLSSYNAANAIRFLLFELGVYAEIIVQKDYNDYPIFLLSFPDDELDKLSEILDAKIIERYNKMGVPTPDWYIDKYFVYLPVSKKKRGVLKNVPDYEIASDISILTPIGVIRAK